MDFPKITQLHSRARYNRNHVLMGEWEGGKEGNRLCDLGPVTSLNLTSHLKNGNSNSSCLVRLL